MKIGLFVHKIHQFELDTGKNTQDRCEADWLILDNIERTTLFLNRALAYVMNISNYPAQLVTSSMRKKWQFTSVLCDFITASLARSFKG